MIPILKLCKMNTSDETKLVVKVQNQNPIGLLDLTLSLTNLSLQYSRFLSKSGCEINKYEDQLYVKDVKELKNGSAIIELIDQNKHLITDNAGSIMPAIVGINSIGKFLEYLKNAYDYLLGKKKEKPEFFPDKKRELEQLNDLVGITAKDPNSTIQFSVVQNAQTINNYNITYQEANASQNVLKSLMAKTI